MPDALHCSTCHKIFPHFKSDAPLIHLTAEEHCLQLGPMKYSPNLEAYPWVDEDVTRWTTRFLAAPQTQRYTVVYGGKQHIEATSAEEAYQMFWVWMKAKCDAGECGLIVEVDEEAILMEPSREAEIKQEVIAELMKSARLAGYLEGLQAFAWWRDGRQYVGTSGMTLEEAMNAAWRRGLWNQHTEDYPESLEGAI